MTESPLDMWKNSAAAWIASVDKGDTSRSLLLDSAMLETIGPVEAKRVLDIGCGEGRFCRMLSDLGAVTTGIEPTQALLDRAREFNSSGKYIRGSGEALPIADNSCDLAIFYLVILDIPDYKKAIQEATRVLRPGGRLVVADMNSFITASPDWKWDEETESVELQMKDYFVERGNVVSWSNVRVVNFHRPLSHTLTAFLDAGLVLKSFKEPMPKEEVRINRSMRIGMAAPFFYIAEWQTL